VDGAGYARELSVAAFVSREAPMMPEAVDLHLRQWKNGPNAYRQLRARRLSHQDAAKVAGNLRSWWRNSHMALKRALPPSYFDSLGLPRLAA
jgi:hypothetical protein